MQNSDRRDNLVVKSNALIQKTRYELSLQEQKLVLYMISKIKPTDDDLMEYKIPLHEICEVCGIEKLGQNYKNIKDCIWSLADKTVEFEDERVLAKLRWIEMPIIYKRENALSIRINPLLKPYLLALQENFTQYELGCALVMKSKYGIRLYELLKSYVYYGELEISIEELKNKLQTTKYADYKNFRVKVIEKALDEINTYTDLDVTFEPIRMSHAVTSLRFVILRKSSVEQVAVRVRRNAEIDRK